jgi:hypothetical protein
MISVVLYSTMKQPSVMRHFLPSGNGSGWFVWTEECDGSLDFFDMMHARHFIEKYPKIEKYLNLESGWSFVSTFRMGMKISGLTRKNLLNKYKKTPSSEGVFMS